MELWSRVLAEVESGDLSLGVPGPSTLETEDSGKLVSSGLYANTAPIRYSTLAGTPSSTRVLHATHTVCDTCGRSGVVHHATPTWTMVSKSITIHWPEPWCQITSCHTTWTMDWWSQIPSQHDHWQCINTDALVQFSSTIHRCYRVQ